MRRYIIIEIKNINKTLGKNHVLKDLSLTINDGCVFGLVGINGAGKSTLLRTLSGILKVESGEILIDEENIYENPKVKEKFFFLPDEPYYPMNSTGLSILELYKSFYEIDTKEYLKYLEMFNLNSDESINNYSKGMKRQLFISLALAIAPKYLFLDEAFDGLDPLSRLVFKRIINNLISENNITIIISSHSLRELEDICDSYGLLDDGKIINTGSIIERKNIYHKFQLAFEANLTREDFTSHNLEIVSFNQLGRIFKIIIKGNEENCYEELKKLKPLLIDKIPIDFEELFIIEVGEKGYLKNEE